MYTPEPCLKRHCYSPGACGGWGYCRERNSEDHGGPSEEMVWARRAIAAQRSDEDEPEFKLHAHDYL